MPPILVNQGLVQSDPVTLSPGELSLADNTYYKVADPILYKARGRTAFNSTPEATSILGVRALQFDGTAGLFAALVGSSYRKATIGATGTFSDLVTGLAGTAISLDSVHYNNEHVLLNGIDRNRVVRSDGTAILHGMLAATTTPGLSLTGVGTGFTLGANNTVIYWIEERYKEGSTIVKRHASTSTQTVTLTGTGVLVKPVIARPLVVNSDATHWALFATATNGSFPVGAEIAEVPIATASIEDTRTGTDPTLPSGSTYETVSTTDQFGVTQARARNGPPPIAASGDIMEGSLVLPSVTDKSILQFSITNKIHQFPANYFIAFETKEEDEIIGFRFVGSVGVVLLRDSAWAVNTLPKPDDAQFATDRVSKQIDGAFGCVGPKAFDLFSFGDGVLLAYVAPEGIVWTDGRSWSVVTDDLDFENLIEPTALHRTVLINDRDNYTLKLLYTPLGGTANTKQILLHYHPSHIKTQRDAGTGESTGTPRAKITGPNDAPANDGCIAYLNRKHALFTANTDAKLYLENTGYSMASGESPVMRVTGRDEYLAGIGGESHVRSVLVHHPAAPGQSATVTMIQLVHGQAPAPATVTIPLDYREATPTFGQAMADALQFQFEATSTTAEVGVTMFVPIFQESALEGK